MTEPVTLSDTIRAHPLFDGLTDDAATMLCAIYLTHPSRNNLGMSDEDFILSMASLQEAGFIRILTDQDGNFSIQLVSPV